MLPWLPEAPSNAWGSLLTYELILDFKFDTEGFPLAEDEDRDQVYEFRIDEDFLRSDGEISAGLMESIETTKFTVGGPSGGGAWLFGSVLLVADSRIVAISGEYTDTCTRISPTLCSPDSTSFPGDFLRYEFDGSATIDTEEAFSPQGTYSLRPIPEPTSELLFAIGALVVGNAVRKKTRLTRAS